jgi:hypothetical protein
VADDPNAQDSVDLNTIALPGDALFNLVPSAISIQDHAFRIRKINRTFRELFFCEAIIRKLDHRLRNLRVSKEVGPPQQK